MPLTKAITLDFLKRFFGFSRTRSLTARTLSSVILRSLRLFPVAIAAQIIGMGSLVLMYWETEYSRVFLISWTAIWLAQVIVALVFVRKFWRDDARVKNVRAWVRRWTVLAVVTGSIWGLTGILFVVQGSGLLQVMTVAITVAVTFAGWPVYSCVCASRCSDPKTHGARRRRKASGGRVSLRRPTTTSDNPFRRWGFISTS